ncbi:hypothetical protein DL89DRAFT_262808 [Linderina pennispora]|uniref:Secreted protein n=1 Tax=Linderina pennispora TaxID=61395 RepID=A0A1Y1VS11_9FUNG|nr:uncharacterized protein DL89DRAFT_262808 [Linderina pennispora]ORX64080.1 hypothetical protein DL89DRAFT_262808 [Linderina pennispora]
MCPRGGFALLFFSAAAAAHALVKELIEKRAALGYPGTCPLRAHSKYKKTEVGVRIPFSQPSVDKWHTKGRATSTHTTHIQDAVYIPLLVIIYFPGLFYRAGRGNVETQVPLRRIALMVSAGAR